MLNSKCNSEYVWEHQVFRYVKELSGTFECNAGVKQGKNLPRILFAYYMKETEEKCLSKNYNLDFGEDFVSRLMEILVLLYVDGTVILCDSEKNMRRVLLVFHSYSNEWKWQ